MWHEEESNHITHRIRVGGTSCENCAGKIQLAILAIPGVLRAEVSHARREAVVDGTAGLDDLMSAVKAVGFVALPWSEEREATTVKLRIDGTRCQGSCAAKVQNALLSVQGVTSAEVSHARREAVVDGTASLDDLMSAVKAVGFVALPWGEKENKKNEKSVYFVEETFIFPDLPENCISSPTSTSSHLRRRSSRILRSTFLIDGMSCGACVNKVEKKLQEKDGVSGVQVSLLSGLANVDMSSTVSVHDICKSISELGFSAKHMPLQSQGSDLSDGYCGLIELKVPDLITDVTCGPTVERRLQSMPGVSKVSVLERYGIVNINTMPIEPLGPRDAIDAITSLGYSAELKIQEGAKGKMLAAQENESKMWKRLFLISLVLMTPMFISKLIRKPISPWWMAIFTSIIQFYVGGRFYRAAWLSAKHWNFGMDALVVMGTTLSYGYSLSVLIANTINPSQFQLKGHIFFEASSMLITFISLGKYFEAKAKGRTGSALSLLMELQPHTVILVDGTPEKLRGGDRDRIIDIALVRPGDLLRIIPGAQVPTDGVVFEGSSYVDESMITGEPTAVLRGPGDDVVGGSVNQNGMFLMQASKVGGDTLLSQIVRLVEEAQMSKASIQTHADKLASIFTPVILSVALVSFIVWYVIGLMGKVPEEWSMNEDHDPFLFALLFAISTVVISCPCALGLATPTAVMVGTCVGATNGLLVKGGKVLELADGVTAVVFDKTGTITTGMTVLSDEISFLREPNNGDHETLALAACAEVGSEHPIGRCIVNAVHNLGIETVKVTDFTSSPGQGICCQHPSGRVSVGNRSWMASQNIYIDNNGEIEKVVSGLEEEGKTVVLVALDRRIVGALAVSDKVKSEARSTVLALNRLGIDVWMVTGDNHRAASAVAKSVGIPSNHVLASVKPEEKAEKVKELQNNGFRVAMVGDGINDSPSLALADLGIALGTGTQVAMEAAEIVLIRNNLHDVVVSLHLCRKVVKRIKLNLLWALMYNLGGIPMAAGVLYPFFHVRIPPSFAGLCMTLSSICVVLSSLSLNLYVKPHISDEGFIEIDGSGQEKYLVPPLDDSKLDNGSSDGKSIPNSWFRNKNRNPYRSIKNKIELPYPLSEDLDDDETETLSPSPIFEPPIFHDLTPRTRLGHFV